MAYKAGVHLEQINFPQDLRDKFQLEDLPLISDELRQYIIDVVSEIGNSHFGANLGVIELTVALHYVFNTPKDLLVWDIGHQAYGHKILTGRRDIFHTNRTKNGISGFPKRSESIYDTFGVGHSSTSISAVLGMAIANSYKGDKEKHHIAVIGDGALTAGLAFEALNHAGSEKDLNLLIIVNDNGMSIDPNVGALKESFSKQNNLFETLDFNYFGPVDGHNVIDLAKKLKEIKDIPGPKVLHCITKKGWGYKYSEEGNPTHWHAPGVFNKNTGETVDTIPKSSQPPKYQDVFGTTILELAQQNEKIMGITPAMPTGSSLNIMMNEMPDRAFDVGIAEQHAVTLAAGMATQGLIPFCTIYSTFLQRAYDQIIHDVAIQNLPVIFCIDRAGLVGEDGATHHGVFDIAYLRCIPNLVVFAPLNEVELRNMLYTAQLGINFPLTIRYPRGRGTIIEWKQPFSEIEIGKGTCITEGEEIAVLSFGTIGNRIIELQKELPKNRVAHYNMRFVKPLDVDLLHKIFSKFKTIVTIEDGTVIGGFGSAFLEFAAENNYKNTTIKTLGIPDNFIEHGKTEALFDTIHLSNVQLKNFFLEL